MGASFLHNLTHLVVDPGVKERIGIPRATLVPDCDSHVHYIPMSSWAPASVRPNQLIDPQMSMNKLGIVTGCGETFLLFDQVQESHWVRLEKSC